MTKDKKILYLSSLGLFIFSLLSLLLPFNESKIIIACVIIPIACLICYFNKKRNILSINKRQVLLLVLVIALVYLMLLYLSGLMFGFYKSTLPLSLISFVKVIVPISLTIIASEVIRRVLLAQNNKIVDIFTYISCVLLETVLFSTIYGISSFNTFMDFIGLNLIPAVTSNLLYNYLSKRYGYYPNIVFRLLITLYPYFIPVEPATPDSLVSFVKLVLPLLIYIFIDALYEKKKKFAKAKESKFSNIGTALTFVLMVSIVMLISGQFKYSIIVVGSDSMTGELNKGDVVLYERYDDQILEKGNIIVFEKNDTVTIHRIVDIQRINEQNRYYTKGDANDDLDYGYITDVDIIGVSNFKISYIGYPTIWINNIFS